MRGTRTGGGSLRERPIPPDESGTQSKRALATRNALLGGASSVFVERGFEHATIAEIVERAGASVGSLYNQFGGKAELFLALHERYTESLWETTTAAMEDARVHGVREPLEVYLTGARAYLLGCWAQRDLARLFLYGDAPPGFAAVRRDNLHHWVRQNALVLQADQWHMGESFAAAVTGVVAAGVRQICGCESEAEARELTEYFAELVTRLTRPTTHSPPVRRASD